MSIAFPKANVKLFGSCGGISIGEGGQMGIGDIALATSLPNFSVAVPADGPSMRTILDRDCDAFSLLATLEKGGHMDREEMSGEARLDGKVAVVTGGGRGIGRATAITLAQAGASVMVTARTGPEIEETAKQIRQAGGSARVFPADVSDWDAMVGLAGETERVFGPADVVVANAGVIEPVGHAWQVSPRAWAKNLNINLTGAFYAARAFLPAMVERGQGVLIFTSSGAATHPVAGWSAYCAAKAGLDHLVRNLAAEIDERGLSVRAHVFYPGIVDTSMQKRIRGKSAETFPRADQFRDYHEQGRLRPPGEPAALVWWLATPMAAEFHGKPVSLDDPSIRRRMADDLGLPLFEGRGG